MAGFCDGFQRLVAELCHELCKAGTPSRKYKSELNRFEKALNLLCGLSDVPHKYKSKLDRSLAALRQSMDFVLPLFKYYETIALLSKLLRKLGLPVHEVLQGVGLSAAGDPDDAHEDEDEEDLDNVEVWGHVDECEVVSLERYRVDERALEMSGSLTNLTAAEQVGPFLVSPPPNRLVWLGRVEKSSTVAAKDGRSWVLSVRNHKVFAERYLVSFLCRALRRFPKLTSILVLGNGGTVSWRDSEEDNGVVSEVLQGDYGIEACRWLLNHIWRGNVRVNKSSSTRCYCPHTESEDGYSVCALLPFEAVADTRFYLHRATSEVYWYPRDGDKLRRVTKTAGGSLCFVECDFEAEDFVRCSIEVGSTCRIG